MKTAKENQVLTKAQITEKFLKSLLGAGPIDSETAFKQMAYLGFPKRSVELAKASLGIKSVKREKIGEVQSSWTWYLDGQKPLGVDWEKKTAKENQ